ncbi:hypothetical protein NYZ99_11780 [Maribacter litopenaei]|uniref:Uncharacterized protein n=1 Tax=Maribacter litopenaei TaxID=2976127 RepID=A0ABY5Y478_9FLAO|nr:hypothetical protein [Maribacter litopenaei]UWX53815.1 hypothetical protein NYZ99_11780 [Maribacter litopenaei]
MKFWKAIIQSLTKDFVDGNFKTMKQYESFSFKETHEFTPWWMWLFLIVAFSLSIYNLITNSVTIVKTQGEVDAFTQVLEESKVTINMWAIYAVLLSILFIALFLVLKLEISIKEQELQIHFYPFFKKSISIEEIKSIASVLYAPKGLGLLVNKNYGNVYNIKAKKGIQVLLYNGDNYFIGSEKASELAKLLKEKVGQL